MAQAHEHGTWTRPTHVTAGSGGRLAYRSAARAEERSAASPTIINSSALIRCSP
jgi:hypothetical protein